MVRVVSSIALISLALAGHARAASEKVGTALAAQNSVSIEEGSSAQRLRKGGVVLQDQVLVTGKSSSAEIEFLDSTKLAVGAEARIVLDKMVFDPSAPQKVVTLNLAKGAFRFITGNSPKEAYEIKTPTATMGVRGTVFDVYVSDQGETSVLLHEGAVDVCATQNNCVRHDKKGRIVHASLARILSEPLRWDRAVFGGLAFASAFPFLGKRLVIDPVRRVGNATYSAGRAIGRAVNEPVRQIQRVLRPPF